MQTLEFIFQGKTVELTYRLNAFSSGDMYHVVIKDQTLQSEVGKDHFFQTCREGEEITSLEFSITMPDSPKNQFRIILAGELLKLNPTPKSVRRIGK